MSTQEVTFVTFSLVECFPVLTFVGIKTVEKKREGSYAWSGKVQQI